jgi:hypothetical protein
MVVSAVEHSVTPLFPFLHAVQKAPPGVVVMTSIFADVALAPRDPILGLTEIGRASCRERV